MNGPLTIPTVPARPRNLAAFLAPWLQKLGFTISQEENYRLTKLQADWLDADGRRFSLLYCHYHPEADDHTALASLHVRPAGELQGAAQCLVSATHIRKTSEVRLLLLHNKCYKEARQSALNAGTLHPA